MDVDGATYVPVGGTTRTYTYGDANFVQYVYYVPEGYTPAASYDVTVQYVNIATGKLIESHTESILPDSNADTAIESVASFTLGGTTFVRLDGQDQPFEHSYYSNRRTYTYYYRDAADTTWADAVVSTITVLNTSRADNTVASTGTATDASAANAGLPSTDEVTSVEAADGSTSLYAEDGTSVDTNREEILDDNETPLASGFDTGAHANYFLANPAALVGAIAGIAVLAVLVALIMRKRKKQSESGLE